MLSCNYAKMLQLLQQLWLRSSTTLATSRLPPFCNRPDVPGNKLIPCSGQIPFLGPLTALSSLKQFSFLLWALLNVSLKVR